MSIDVAWLRTKFTELTDLASLSAGGQKWVFSAKHASDGDVVLKLFKPSGTPSGVELVFREMLAVQTVASDRIPKILAHNEIDTPLGKCFWFREQRISGEPLDEALKPGPLNTKRLLLLGLHILEALVPQLRVGAE